MARTCAGAVTEQEGEAAAPNLSGMCRAIALLRALALTTCVLPVTLAAAQPPAEEATQMATLTIRWWGQACFTISDGTRTVLVDPFPADFGYKVPDIEPQVVLVTHEHRDHNAVDAVKGQPTVLLGPGPHPAAGLSILGVAAFHDAEHGAKRGPDTIFAWEMAGLKLVHLGDLGHVLTDEQIAAIGPPVDVLMIPVGGYYTIDATQAVQVSEQLRARIILPMHVRTEALARLPIAPVDDFLQALPQGWELQQPTAPTLTLKHDDVPTAGCRVIVLPYE